MLSYHMNGVFDHILDADGVREGICSEASSRTAYLILLVWEGIEHGDACSHHLNADHEVLKSFAILWCLDFAPRVDH